MSYQRLSIEEAKIEDVKKNYKEQIEALQLFFKDARQSSIPDNAIKFGGGTALSMYYFQHRLSFDVDLFLTDQQFLSYFSPKHWIEDSSNFDGSKYIDSHNHIGVVSSNDIKVDILVDSSSTSYYMDDTKEIFPFDIRIESIEDILAKKIVFRKKDNKARDIFDIAVAIDKDPLILHSMLNNDRINLEDLSELKKALESLNMEDYLFEISLVEPIDDYINLGNNAPNVILNKLNEMVADSYIKEHEKSDFEGELKL